MTSINSLSSYLLPSLLSSGSGSSTSSGALSASSIESLAQALDSGSSSGSGSGASSYLLDLSPAAQQILNASSATASSTSSASGSSASFVLTKAQEATIESIVAKYKDSPIDTATVDAIGNALSAAGLSPQALAAQNLVSSFSATGSLLDALNGNFTNVQSASTSISDEQTKETNYLQSILDLWKSEIPKTSSGSGGSTATTTSSGSGSSSSNTSGV